MPELPEVETVRRSLLKKLIGRKVTGVNVSRPDSIGFPEPDQFADELIGHEFKDIERRGKYLLFKLDRGAFMGAHLRMSGRLLVAGRKVAREEHIRVVLDLDNGQELIFEDMRVFGRLWYVPKGSKPEAVISGLADLGIEPLEGLTGHYMKEAFENRTQAIKTALLDQTVIAGIGNIYADESLHQAGVHPQRPANSLTDSEYDKLAKCVIEVLAKAIEMRGSTLRNYTDSSGVNGGYQGKAWVYGREGEPCRGCGTEIERIKLAGRSSHFCPECQPLGRKTRAAKKKRRAGA